jgi:hypothetical protein
MTVPITSATYAQNSESTAAKDQATPDGSQNVVSSDFPLSTLNPYQSVSIEIKIIPLYQSSTPTLQNINVTLVWSNHP